MTREEFEEAKRQSAKVAEMLKDDNLTDEERQKLETFQAQLSGLLMSTWLPFGWGSRLIMLILFLFGAVALLQENSSFPFGWILLLFFSPRAVGIATYTLGRFIAGLNNKT